MKKFLYLLMCSLFVFSSCTKIDMDNLDTDVSLKSSWRIPVGHSRITVFDMVNLVDDPMWIADSTGNIVYLHLKDTVYLDVTDKVVNFEYSLQNIYALNAADISANLPVPIPTSGLAVTNATADGINQAIPAIHGDFDYDFNDYEEGVLVQRVDFLRVTSAKLNISAVINNIDGISPSTSKIAVTMKLPNSIGIETKTYNAVFDGSGNTATFDIANYEMDFAAYRANQTMTGIDIQIALIVPNGSQVTLYDNSSVSIGIKVSDINIYEAIGFMNHSKTITSDDIFTDLPENLYGIAGENRLLFYNPSVRIDVENNVGVPVNFVIDYFRAIDTSTTPYGKVDADFNGSPSYVLHLGTPALPFQSAWVNTTFDRQNGATNRLFEIKASKLEYQFHAEIDHVKVNGGLINHFIVGNPFINMLIDVRLPFHFDATTQYTSRDTINANLDSLLNTISFSISPERVVVDISYKNHLPIQAVATAIFVDKDNFELYRKPNIKIECPNVDANGFATNEKVSVIQIDLAEQDSENIMKTAKIITEYSVTGQDATSQINVRGTDYLDAVVSLVIKGRIETNIDSLFK